MNIINIKYYLAVSASWTFILMVLPLYQDFVVAAPATEYPHRVLYAQSNNGHHRAGFSGNDDPHRRHNILYGYAGANRDTGLRYGVGYMDHTTRVNKNFGVSHKIGVLGAEVDYLTNKKLGSMARVTAIDGTLHAGPVDVNYGINLDTGVTFDGKDYGVEAKFLGIGGKASSKGFEVCFIVCGGVNW